MHDGEVAEVGVVEVAVVVHVDLRDARPVYCGEGAGGCVGRVEETSDVGCTGGGGVGAGEDVVGEGAARGGGGALSPKTLSGWWGGLHVGDRRGYLGRRG